MLTKFWEGIGEKLADRWVSVLLGPAFIFWGGGLLAWITHFGWTQFQQQVTQLPEPMLIIVLVGGLLVVASSAAALQLLVLPILRVIEGYWWGWLSPLRRLFIWWQSIWLDRAERRWQELAVKESDNLTPAEREEYVELDRRRRQAPTKRNLRMPTKLGNILRAAEQRPDGKYGLETNVCWPRLWLVLPDSARSEISAARSRLDTAVRIEILGALFLIWTIWAWWAGPIGILIIFFAYRWALSAAGVYGDLLESAFDLYRMKLYETLHWPLPERTDCEQQQGQQLTEYLFRGTLKQAVTLVHSKENNSS
jgi:hypothetical protein